MFELSTILAVVFAVVCLAAVWWVIATSGADVARMQAIQKNQWQIGQIDGHFAVIAGSPPKIIGKHGKDVRKVLDEAMGVVEVPNG